METKIQQFLDPAEVLAQVELKPGMTVADFGCGNGYYAVAAAKLIGPTGQVYAVDIMEEALSQTASLARLQGIYNISTLQCDLESLGDCGLPDMSCDLVILASILHQVENQENLLRQAYRVLKTGGQVLLVEWTPDAPFGPQPGQRLSAEAARATLEKTGLRPVRAVPAGSFHYAWLFGK